MNPLLKLLLPTLLAGGVYAQAQLPVGELYATDASVHGSVSLMSGGTTVLSGSSISSGTQTAILRIARGGSLSVCAGTRVSVSVSASGRDMMFSLGEGAIETHYEVSSAADAIITPDLRLLIVGPGEFDLSIKISPNGDTCVKSAPTSRGSVIVSELMGDGTYQVKPSDFILFRAGRVTGAQVNPSGLQCGCPAASASPPAAVVQLQGLPLAQPPVENAPLPGTLSKAEPPAAEHVQADLRLAFDANSQDNNLAQRIVVLSVRRLELTPSLRAAALPPAVEAERKPEKRGFWKKLGAWFKGSGYR